MSTTPVNMKARIGQRLEEVQVRGVKVLRVKSSSVIASKNRSRYDIINIRTGEYLCQLTARETRKWLIEAGAGRIDRRLERWHEQRERRVRKSCQPERVAAYLALRSERPRQLALF